MFICLMNVAHWFIIIPEFLKGEISMESKRLENATGYIERKTSHLPSKVHPDTLFNFTNDLHFLRESLEHQKLFPRYIIEDIRYLSIPQVKYIAYPMKCFCDINLHQINEHLDWYGYYGLAFTKEWGMKKGIQPVQYINKKSELIRDFREAFRSSLKDTSDNKPKTQLSLANFLMHELMFYKPYSGMQVYRITGKPKIKNFSDECEWRYVANVEKLDLGYDQILVLNSNRNDSLKIISNSLKKIDSIAIPFSYSELKYIIVKDEVSAKQLMKSFEDFDISDEEKESLIMKMIVWENVCGDF